MPAPEKFRKRPINPLVQSVQSVVTITLTDFDVKHWPSEICHVRFELILTELQLVSDHRRTPRWEYHQLGSTTHSSFPLFNQSVHLKRISLFWDFNPVSELISGTQGLVKGDGRGIKATQLQPCCHNYTHKASRRPINQALIMPLGKLILWGSWLGHVGQIVDIGLVDFQAFSVRLKHWR